MRKEIGCMVIVRKSDLLQILSQFLKIPKKILQYRKEDIKLLDMFTQGIRIVEQKIPTTITRITTT